MPFANKPPAVQSFQDAQRQLLEDNFLFFVDHFFKVLKGGEFDLAPHHLIIINALMKVYDGEIQNLIINVPPRYSKTLLVVHLFSAWGIAKNHKSEFIHLSYSDPLALDNSDQVKTIVKSAEFQSFWDVPIKSTKDSKKAWGTEAGGVFYATAAGGSVTGFGAGRLDEWDGEDYIFSGAIIIDDPLKPDDARSDTKREAVNRRWDETIKSRRNSSRTPTIVIMQRLHEHDFCGMLLEDKETEWHHIAIPALKFEGTDHQEPLWAKKHSLDDLLKMKERNPYMFAGQMQQSPSPLGGGLMKRAYWNYYNDHRVAMSLCNMFFWTADTAYTSDDANDPSAICLWGCMGSKKLFLIDCFRDWLEFPDLVAHSKKLIETYRNNNGFYVEAKASGLSLVQNLRKKGINAKQWKPQDWKYPVDKVGRVNESLFCIANGDVCLPLDGIINSVTGKKIEWSEPFVAECEKFTVTDSHLHDDQVDAMTMAVSIWRHYAKI